MTEKIDFKAEYEKLRKKYNLPDFEVLNKEFELVDMEKKENVPRALRRRLREKLIFFCRIVEGIIYPTERSPLATYESSFFDDFTKLQLSKIHRMMMVFDRKGLCLDVEDSEEKNMGYILDLLKEWPGLKRELLKTVVLMERSWQNHIEEKAQGYFG